MKEKKEKGKVVLADLAAAIDALNESGLIGDFVNVKKGEKISELAERFMQAVESISEDKESDIPEKVVNMYNTLVEMEEIEEAEVDIDKEEAEADIDKEEADKANAESKPAKEKKDKGSAKKAAKKAVKDGESRPAMLRRKYESGLTTLEELYADKELMAKYNGMKSWIKSDLKKIKEKK